MPELTGTIDDIYEGTTQKGRKYYKLLVDGVSCFVWEAKKLEGFKINDKVKARVSEDEYPKLQSLELIERPKPTEASTSPANAQQTSVNTGFSNEARVNDYTKAKNEQINRSVALKAAVELYAKILGSSDDMDLVSDKVVKLSQFFEKYLNS